MPDYRIPGADAPLRALAQRITDLEATVRQLRGQTGTTGGTYSDSTITVGSGGRLVGEGAGQLAWAGPATFTGPLSITGALTLLGNAIPASAVDGQATATSVTNGAANYAITRTGWTSIVSVSVPRPAWATRAVIFTTATIAPRVQGQAYSYVRARIVDDAGTGPVAPAVFNQQTLSDPGIATASPGKVTLINNPSATVTCRAEAIHEHTANAVAADTQSTAGIGVVAVWLRGT